MRASLVPWSSHESNSHGQAQQKYGKQEDRGDSLSVNILDIFDFLLLAPFLVQVQQREEHVLRCRVAN